MMKSASLINKVVALCLLLSLTACHHHDDEPTAKYKRTILVYIAGNNNLTNNYSRIDFAKNDIDEIVESSKKLSTDNKLVLFVDKYNMATNSKEKPYVLLVEQGDTTRLMTMEEEVKTSSAETLHDIMKYAMDTYEAESYGLVLWGHCDGWIIRNMADASRTATRAYGQDDSDGDSWMDIPEMAQALSTLPRLKFIFADCCSFQCVEAAYELRKCADYIIASAAEIPGEGAPYVTVMPALFSQSTTFYEQAVDAYYAQNHGIYKEPLSVVNTSELENLAQATHATLATILPQMDDGGRYPNVDGLIYYFDHTQFDMNDFILRYADANQYAEWKRVFDKAVVYSKMATVWLANHVNYTNYEDTSFRDFEITAERYGGLGMFVPQLYANFSGYRNTTFNIERLNTNIQYMQWYKDAGLDKLGW